MVWNVCCVVGNQTLLNTTIEMWKYTNTVRRVHLLPISQCTNINSCLILMCSFVRLLSLSLPLSDFFLSRKYGIARHLQRSTYIQVSCNLQRRFISFVIWCFLFRAISAENACRYVICVICSLNKKKWWWSLSLFCGAQRTHQNEVRARGRREEKCGKLLNLSYHSTFEAQTTR